MNAPPAPDCTELYEGKPLYYWAGQGDIGPVKILINGGCDPNATSSTDTPFVAAIKSKNPGTGTLDIVKWLIKTGTVNDFNTLVDRSDSSNSSTDDGHANKAIYDARSHGIFGFLLSYDNFPVTNTSQYLTPWHTAAEYLTDAYVTDQMVAMVWRKEAINEFYHTTPVNITPLMVAASRDRPSQILRRYIDYGVKLERTSSGDYQTALHYAARKGHVANVRQIIKAGANVNAGREVSGGMSPIFAAVEGAKSIERTNVVKALIKAGGKVTDAAGNKPSVSDEHHDAAALKAIIDNPKPYWPVRAYALGIPFNPPAPDALATTSWLDIGCHESGGSCFVYFDCTDDSGAKTGNAIFSAGVTVTYSDSASSPNTTTIAGQLGLESDERWNGMLDCALHSYQKITAQIWSRTGTTLADNTDYLKSDKNKEAILQRVHPQGSSQRMAVRIRCIDRIDCKSTSVNCRSATGTTASNMSIDVGKIDRLKTKTLYNYARGDDASDFPTGIASCTVKSKGVFLVQALTNSNGVLLNHTGISME